MTTLTIELTNSKALKLLQDLEELKLIRVVKKSTKLSDLRKQIKTPMTSDEIDNKLKELRSQWERNI